MPASTVVPPPVPTSQPDGDVRSASATDPPREISPVEIAREAYARYVARGRQDGHDVEDWLAAEESLRIRTMTHETRGQEERDARARRQARQQNDAGEEKR